MVSSTLTPVEREPRLRIIMPLVIAIAFLMEHLDSTILTTAIPDIARSLHVDAVRLNLAVTAYVLTLAVFIPLSGWLADRYGARRVFICALGTFTVGSALCGIAGSFNFLVVTRIVQGLGGAMMTPVGRLILLRSFPRSQRVTAVTYMTLPAIFGPVAGPLLGGFLTTYANWRWIFYVNLPIGLIGMLLASRFLVQLPTDRTRRFDFVGFAFFGGAIALLQIGIETLSRHPRDPLGGLVLLGLTALMLLAFAYYSRRVPAPIVNLALFRQRCFAIGTMAGGLCRIALNASPFLLPLMLQLGFGLSPVASGSLTFLSAIGAFSVRLIIARMLRAWGFSRTLILSALAASLSLGGFALMTPATPHWLLGGYIALLGLVRSTQYMSSNTLAYAETPAPLLSQATSLAGLFQQLTASLGVSLAALLLTLVDLHGEPLAPRHFHWVFELLTILPLLSIGGFLRLRPEDGSQVSGYRTPTSTAAPR